MERKVGSVKTNRRAVGCVEWRGNECMRCRTFLWTVPGAADDDRRHHPGRARLIELAWQLSRARWEKRNKGKVEWIWRA